MRPVTVTPQSVRQMVPTTQARLEASSFVQRANAAMGVAASAGHVTLLVHRDESNVGSYVITPPGTDAKTAGFHLAQALGARSAEVSEEGMPDLDGSDIAHMEVDRNPIVARYMQTGVDPMELPRIIANNLMSGEWVAVTARPKTGRESKRWRRWLEYNAGSVAGSHHSMEANAMAYTIVAGSRRGPDFAAANLRAITAGMPGFDITSQARPVSDSRRTFLPALVALASLVLALFAPKLLGGTLPDTWVASARALLGGVAAAGVIAAMLRHTDRWVPSQRKLVLAADRLAFRPPPLRRGRVTPPRPQKIDREGKVTPEEPGDYPMEASVFMGSPSMFVSMAAPAAGAESGLRETGSRTVPPQLTTRVGPLIGRDPHQGTPVHLFASRQRFGVAVTGMAGSGKSQVVRSLFAWSLLDKMCPASDVEGAPGPRNSHIVFENKGPDGAEYYQRWAQTLGANVAFSELADPDSPAIDFFASGAESPKGRARDFVDAMIYAWSEQEIGNRAKDVLIRTINAGLIIEADQRIVEEANLGLEPGEDRVPLGRSAITYAQILCGGGAGGDATAVRLAAAIRSLAPDEPPANGGDDADLWEAATDIGQLFVNVTERDRRTRFESSLNKLERLVGCEAWFSPSRRKTTWQFVLNNHKDIVLNLGMSMSGRSVSDDELARMSAIAMFTLKQSIARTCSGWGEQNRWVSVFADELALLAGSSAEVVMWFRDMGRSFGVRPIFATQRPDQLPFDVRQALISMETLIALAQSNPDVIRQLVDDFSLDGTDWSPQDIAQLPMFTAVIRTTGPKGRLPSLVCRMDFFEGDMPGFRAAQGYADGGQALTAGV